MTPLGESSLGGSELSKLQSLKSDCWNACQGSSLGPKMVDLVEADKRYRNRNGIPRSFPALPCELVILIFKCAARDSKAMAVSLSLVSRLARAAVLPLLFHSLILQERRDTPELARFLNTHPHIAMHIRKLWLRQNVWSDVMLILPCVKLEQLAAHPSLFNSLCGSSGSPFAWFKGHATDRTSICTPHELLVFPGCIRWHDFALGADQGFAHSFFHGITHLRLTQASQLKDLLRCKAAKTALSQFTHLATPVTGPLVEIAVEEVLSAFPALRMFIVTPRLPYDPWLMEWRLGLTAEPHSSFEIDSSSWDYVLSLDNKRMYLLDAGGQRTENYLFESWKDDTSNIWTCARRITDLDQKPGMLPRET